MEVLAMVIGALTFGWFVPESWHDFRLSRGWERWLGAFPLLFAMAIMAGGCAVGVVVEFVATIAEVLR